MVNISTGDFLTVKQVQEGDAVKFLTEGEFVASSKYNYDDGNPRMEFIMKVEHGGKEYSMRVNKTSRDELAKIYGTETKDWVGKYAKITIETYRSLGTKGIILEPVKIQKADEQEIERVEKAWDEN